MVTPNLALEPSPIQTVVPNLVLGPIPQLTVVPNLVAEASPISVTPNFVVADAPAQTVTPNLALGTIPQLSVIPNLVLGPIPQLTVTPNLVAEVTPIVVTPNFVATEAPQLTVVPNLVLGPVPQINVTPNLAVDAAPQLTVTPNIAVAEVPVQTVVPNLVLGPIPQLTVTPNLVADANPISITPNFVVADAPQQTVTPNLVVADPLAPLSVTPNLQLVPQSEPLFVTPRLLQKPVLDPLFVTPNFKLVPPTEPIEVTPNFQLATLSPLTVTPEIQVQTPVLTVTPEVNVVNPTVTVSAGGTAGSPTTSSFPFDKTQLTDIFQSGIQSALKKYERSPSLGVTLDKDKSGLLTKLATTAALIYSEIKKQLGGIQATGQSTNNQNLNQPPNNQPPNNQNLNQPPNNQNIVNQNIGTTSTTPPVAVTVTPNLSPQVSAAKDLAITSEQLLDSSNQIIDSTKIRSKLIKGITADEQMYLASIKQQQKVSQNIAANAENYENFQVKSKELDKQITTAKSNANKADLGFSKIEQKLINDRIQAGQNALGLYKKEIALKQELRDLDGETADFQIRRQDAIRAGNTSLATSLASQIKTNQYNAELKEKAIKDTGAQLQREIEIRKTAGEILKQEKIGQQLQVEEIALLEQNLDIRKRIEKSTGLLGGMAKAASKIPGIGQYLNADEAINEMEKLAAEIEKSGGKATDFGNRMKIAAKGVDTLVKGLMENLKSPEAIFTSIIIAGFKANKQVVELGKSFGISAKAAENIRQEVAQFSRETGDTFVNTDRLLKAQAELSQEMGMAVKYSNEELVTFAKLTELTGLTAQEAGKLAQASAATGMSTEAYTDKIREGAFSAMQATKTHFSMKEVMQDISKLSAGTLIKFQGNPKALAATVVEAKKLGLSLDQINKTGDTLLNFESSIESELKAELMTGKQLNMERARAAALAGDQATLTKEIGEQVGTLNDYQNMNVLAQQSLAEAFGMSRDEMSEMLMKQEAINQYGEEAGKLNKEQLEEMKRKGLSASEYIQQQEQQRAAQDKFNDAMTKLQDIIGNLVAGPVGQLLDALANMVGIAMKLLSPLSFVFNIIARITEAISDFVSTPFGGIIAGLTGIYLLSGKIAAGLGSMGKGIMDFGKGLISSFKGGSAEGGGFLSKITKSFKGGLAGNNKTKEVSAEKGAENAEKTSESTNKSEAGGDGSKFKTKMQNIADGIKAFADKEVRKGALNLIPASIGLVLFIPGALGAKVVEIVNGEKFQKSMEGIANGIKAFGDNVTLGSLGKLLLGGLALDIFSLGVPGILLLQLVDGDRFRSSMEGIGTGIASFGEKTTMGALGKLLLGGIALDAFALGIPGMLLLQLINGDKFQSSMGGIGLGIASYSENVSAGALVKLLFGGIALAAFSVAVPALLLLQFVNGSLIEKTLGGIGRGIAAFSQNVSYGDLIKGAVAIALLGASLIPFTYAVSLMGDIDPATILIGVGALGALAGIAYLVSEASSNMIVGSLAIAILGAALIPFTYALSLLANVKMENVLAAAAGLVIFGAAVFGLGALMMTGVGAFIFGAGILAMIALGGAMMILGEGLKVVSEGGAGIATLFQQLSELDATKLDAVAPALKIIGEAIMYLGAGGVLSALGNLLGGSSPVDMIKDIAASSDQLQVASTSFKSFAESMEKFTNIDPAKLEALAPALNLLSDSMIALGIGSILMNIGGDPTKMLKSISDSGTGIEKAASGIQLMTNSITQLATSLNSLDISKLEKIAEMSNSGGITGFLSNVFSKITSIMGGSEASSPTAGSIESVTSPGITTTPISTPSSTTNPNTSSTSSNITSTSMQPGIDLTPMIAAINEVKASIDKLYNKNTTINMDGTKVGTTLTQGSYKVA
jgi:hypothetical protein